MRRRAIATEVFTYGAAVSLCDGPAAPAGTTSHSSDAEPCHRAGSVHTQRRPQPVRRASSPRRHDVSCERRGAVPSGRMCSPVVLPSAGATGEQHQQAPRLCRATRLLAITPDWIHYSAAISLRDGPAAPAGLISLLSVAVPRRRGVSACEEGQQRQQSLHLWRQMWRLALVPDRATCKRQAWEPERSIGREAERCRLRKPWWRR